MHIAVRTTSDVTTIIVILTNRHYMRLLRCLEQEGIGLYDYRAYPRITRVLGFVHSRLDEHGQIIVERLLGLDETKLECMRIRLTVVRRRWFFNTHQDSILILPSKPSQNNPAT
jgi:hypothetical protein